MAVYVPGPAAAPYLYVLELQCSGLHVRGLLNDVNIAENGPEVEKISQFKLNPWIVDGQNKIEVQAAAPPPEGKFPGRHLVVTLMAGPHGQEPPPGSELAKFDPRKDLQVQPGEPKTVWQHTFAASPSFGRWAWQDAEPATLSPAVQADIVAALRSFRAALNSHATETALAMNKVRIAELARATGVPEERLRKGFAGACEQWAPSEAPPLTPETLVFSLEAGGRVILVTRKDGAPILSSATSGPFTDRQLYVSRIRGSWTIIR
jgi:hypothetical protein